MSISRRLALGGATALAATSGTLTRSIAAGWNKPQGRGRAPSQPAQRFLELLIHHDEGHGQPAYAEIAIPSSDTMWYAADTLDDTAYRMANHRYMQRGYRLKRIGAFKTKEGVRYSACWQFASGPEWRTRHSMSLAGFNQACAEHKGFRLTHLNVRTHYAAIWEKGDATNQLVLPGLALSEYEQQLAELTQQGYRLLRLCSFHDAVERFAAIFEKTDGPAWQARHGMDVKTFRKTIAQMGAQGYHLVDASGHIESGKASFTGVWEQA